MHGQQNIKKNYQKLFKKFAEEEKMRDNPHSFARTERQYLMRNCQHCKA
jgi:hypothetical protein